MSDTNNELQLNKAIDRYEGMKRDTAPPPPDKERVEANAYNDTGYCRTCTPAAPVPAPQQKCSCGGIMYTWQPRDAEIAVWRCAKCSGTKPIATDARYVPAPQAAGEIDEGQGEATGRNPNYRPQPGVWHTVEVLAPEGYSFGITTDVMGVLGIGVKPPGGEWPAEVTGENTTAPGHKAFVVHNDGASPAPQEAGQGLPQGEIEGAVGQIAMERENQIAHGYDAKHDDEHKDESIADLAAYIATTDAAATIAMPPWASKYADHILHKWAKDRVHQLVIAAALLAAEIERLQRKGGE